MIRQQIEPVNVHVVARCLAGASAAFAALCPLGASASAADHNGNGHHNRTTVAYRSPTHNHGYQHTINGNAGGLNSTQNALCRHSYICHVTQNITIVKPDKPEPAPPVQAIEPAPASPFVYIGPNGVMLYGGDPRAMAFPFSFGIFQ